MKLSVPTNWDISLIEKMKIDSVDEIYAKLAVDAIGGGRFAFSLPQVTKKRAEKYIKLVHKQQLKFNYLLNSTCLGNMEWSRNGQKKLRKLLDWLGEMEVDSVTVSIPYLLQLIKKRYPQFKVCISTLVGISSVTEAQRWQELGADRITLSARNVNRDFKLLRAIRSNLECEIQLIANLYCLKNCPFYLYHGTTSSHSSQLGKYGSRFVIDYSFMMCNYTRSKDPVEIIRSEWIRPEDIHFYEEIGIDRFKLVNRTMTTKAILRIIEAYSNRRYNGNLLDLFPTIESQSLNLLSKLKYFFRPFSINVLKLMKARELLCQHKIYIDNNALDGFIDYFLKEGNCNGYVSCSSCNYCNSVAEKALKIIDKDAHKDSVGKYERFLKDVVSGDIFYYT